MSESPQLTRRLRALSDRGLGELGPSFVAAARDFDPASLGDRLLFPRELTWFHGEPCYEAMAPEQRTKLNHLTFCHYYFLTLNAEASANILNHQAAFGALREDPEAAFYMAREAVEECFHVEAFMTLIRQVLAHHGLAVETFLWGDASARLAKRYYQAHTLLGWLRGNLDAYYFSRFPLNIGTKIAERCILQEPDMHEGVRAIVRSHSIDEARHMRMSRELGKRALARSGSRVLRNGLCVGYAHFVTQLNVCGRQRDRVFPVRVLEACGLGRDEATRAYEGWRRRLHRPEDPPLVQRMRAYFVRQNLDYIDELEVSAGMKRYMARRIRRAYRDVDPRTTPAGTEAAAGAS